MAKVETAVGGASFVKPSYGKWIAVAIAAVVAGAIVLDTKVVQRFPDDIKESPNRTRPSRPIDMLQLFIGDRSKAQVMIETPWTLQHNRIRLGEPVELVVVSDVRNLQRFKVVRDAFLPASQLWISDYPFLARSEMKQLVRGIQVERSR